MTVYYKRFCQKYQKYLTKEEIELHDCFRNKHKSKGHRKNYPCQSLRRIENYG
jgi:hypothetical protein